jgi:hypothetical protein
MANENMRGKRRGRQRNWRRGSHKRERGKGVADVEAERANAGSENVLKRSGGKSEVPKSSLGRREKCR